jgi:hypothetical protein
MEYAQLSRRTFDLLSIPAMSAEYGRTFGKAEYSIPPHYCQFGVDVLKAGQHLESSSTRFGVSAHVLKCQRARVRQEILFVYPI